MEAGRLIVIGVVAIAAWALQVAPAQAAGFPFGPVQPPFAESPQQRPETRPETPPSGHEIRDRVDDARQIAAAAPGAVSFAVIGADGRVHGYREHATYYSASIVKAMLLAAETRRLHAAGAPLDDATESALRAMITVSDNDAASAIFDRVGPEGLDSVAERAGMTDFSVDYAWGFSRVSAADMALFFHGLDRAFPAEHRKFAKGLLGSIVEDQAWGLPDAVPAGWSVRFKGGWRPDDTGQLTHQAAELKRGGRELAIAVLTDGLPSFEEGVGMIEGLGKTLVG